jgi:hypothetical protein
MSQDGSTDQRLSEQFSRPAQKSGPSVVRQVLAILEIQ